MRYLTVALTKGRLANKTMEMFEKAGITCEEMKDKDSRKLIFTNEELKMKFFLAKGPDVPTYVEYGAADIGIVGKDTILEEGRKLYEVMDLGFGKCKKWNLRMDVLQCTRSNSWRNWNLHMLLQSTSLRDLSIRQSYFHCFPDHRCF